MNNIYNNTKMIECIKFSNKNIQMIENKDILENDEILLNNNDIIHINESNMIIFDIEKPQNAIEYKEENAEIIVAMIPTTPFDLYNIINNKFCCLIIPYGLFLLFIIYLFYTLENI